MKETAQASGTVDADGRLVAADGLLSALQAQAGARTGEALAIAPLAGVAQLAQRMGVPVDRSVRVARDHDDVELRVRAVPEADGSVRLWLRDCHEVPAAGEGLHGTAQLVGGAAALVEPPAALNWSCDAQLRLVTLPAPWQALADQFDATGGPIGLTKLLRLDADANGSMVLLDAMAEGRDFADQPARLRDGEDSLFLLAGRAQQDAEGRFTGYRGTARALQAANPAEGGDGAAAEIEDALHDALMSPLDEIIDAAEHIVEREDGPLRSDYASYASDIAAAGRHLLAVIQTMSEEGGEPIAAFDLMAATQEVAQQASAAADVRHVGVDVVPDAAPPYEVMAMARGTRQVLTNLLGNAIRHSPDGGRVRLIVARRGDRLAVTVADEGPGIAPGLESRIFAPYVQGTERQGSAGLGLAISRRLAQEMGGDLQLESRAGEGARFTLTLPAA